MVIEYRVRQLVAAVRKASLELGRYGAAYPWEAGRTGEDVCPGWSYRRYELHVTADVARLVRDYVRVTGDHDVFVRAIGRRRRRTRPDELRCECAPPFLPSGHVTGWDLVRETACFWTSAARWNGSSYVIDHVMGPDEHHFPVNNSAFTNAAARDNILLAAEVAANLGVCSWMVAWWRRYVDRLAAPYDPARDYHPQFDGFDPDTTSPVKQADVALLGFPLGVAMERSTRLNDLRVYERATTRDGPAMTWGAFAVNWWAAGGEDGRARECYDRQRDNVRPPFDVWSENRDGSGQVNFLTGIGGHLQSVVYGWFGLRYERDRLRLRPRLTSDGALRRIVYRCFRFDFVVVSSEVGFVLLSGSTRSTCGCLRVRSVPTGGERRLCDAGDRASFAYDSSASEFRIVHDPPVPRH